MDWRYSARIGCSAPTPDLWVDIEGPQNKYKHKAVTDLNQFQNRSTGPLVSAPFVFMCVVIHIIMIIILQDADENKKDIRILLMI